MNLYELGVREASEGLAAKKFSSVELVQSVIGRVREKDGEIGAYLTFDEEGALAAAKSADDARAAGGESPLLGIPVAIKDLINVKGFVTDAEGKHTVLIGGGQLACVESFCVDTPNLQLVTNFGFDRNVGLNDLGKNRLSACIQHLFAVKYAVGVFGSADGGEKHIVGCFNGGICQGRQRNDTKICFAGYLHTV